MENTMKQTQDPSGHVSRRRFLYGAGGATAAAALAGCGSTGTISLPAVSTFTDADILNFALNLEYLEAEFYLRAATGSGLSTADAGTGAGTVNAVSGSMVLGTTAAQQEYINAIAQDELNHVRFLRSALGSAAVARPNIDFTNAFTAAALAAGVITTGNTFNPFSSFNNFLLGAFLFEDVGVTAYTGAAPLISSSALLNAAAGLQATEAYHAGEIRTLIAATGAAAGSSQAEITAANQISNLRATLGGGNETPISTGLSPTTGAVNSASGSTIVACTPGTSLAYARTTSQVLHIVYATANGAGVSQGGFFPNGLNGNIKTTLA
jgi:hypothetical protein